MNRSSMRSPALIVSLFASLLLSLPSLSATTAGRVVFALGQPQATDTAGAQRVLARGDEVYEGDTLATAARERLQVSLIDGAYISVQPDSTYVIEEYAYSGTPDGTEKSTYRLVKGGVRALTGLIGKSRPEAYKVNTAVATIGIRGTGHNSRLCQGDCGALPDGLYHNTWEGITFVENNVDSQDVPTNRGVYVKDINSLIEFLEQIAGATASAVAAARDQEDERTSTKDDEKTSTRADATIPETRPQVSSTADDSLSHFLMALTIPGSSSPGITGDFGINDLFGFFNTSGQLVGALFFDSDSSPSEPLFAEIRTIDLTAMRNSNDPVATQLVNNFLTSAGSDSEVAADIALFEQNPGRVLEFFADEERGIGMGRWGEGHVLSLFSESESDIFSEVIDLVDNQSVHFIYGPEPPDMLPVTGLATYDFLRGTQSTSLSGATIGQGVTGGTIMVDFATSLAALDMTVNHNSNSYLVAGDLVVSFSDLIFSSGVLATTSASGSACLSGCETGIIGGFSGETSGNPRFIGLEYTIDENDRILGVAGFEFLSLVLASSTVMDFDGLNAITPDFTEPDDVEVLSASSISEFFNDSSQPIGFLFTDDDSMTLQREVATIDLDAMLGGDNPTAVAEVQSLFDSSSLNNTAAASLASNPASVLEFFLDTTNNIGWGRWGNGNILSFDGTDAEIDTLTGNQSAHFIFGNNPPDISGLTSTAFYTFIGGTQSTSVSGATIGNGVIDGTLVVDFSLGEVDVDMTVEHDVFTYNVFGTALIGSTDTSIFDAFPGAIQASSDSLTCIPCDVQIDGGFAGPTVMSMYPQHVGIIYDIQESDVITGAAGFEFMVP